MPKILWQNRRSLLLEYVEGEHPQVEDPEFAVQLADHLHCLHQHRYLRWHRPTYLLAIRRSLRALSNYSPAHREVLEAATEVINTTLPTRLQTCLDYADIKPGNFIIDRHGRLRLIDIGSLRIRWPRGQETAGDNHFPSLNLDVFWQRYLSRSQDDYLAQHWRGLRLVHIAFRSTTTARWLKIARENDMRIRLQTKFAAAMDRMAQTIEQTV